MKLPRVVRRGVTSGVFALCLAAVAPQASAITSAVVASGLSSPIDIAHAGDGSGRLFVVEQGGTVRIVRAGVVAPVPFLDISDLVIAGGERGLLGLAFHPQYASNGRFFVNYTRRPDGATVIAEYRRSGSDANRGDPTSERVLLTIAQPFPNHNGGGLRFGPDGYLYIGMGDGGSANDPGNRAQDPRDLLGKMLRLDVDRAAPYAIPPSNPFADGAGGRPEIYALGLRNPWRFAFDRANGDLYIGDVGQNALEEIDWVPAGSGAGRNFGWRVMEANACTGLGGPVACFSAALTMPILEYSHALGCSVTGGTVYRGTSVAALAGRYVYGDYCSGRIWSAGRGADGAWSTREVERISGSISTFGEDESGELYYADYSNGQIRRFVGQASDRVDAIEYYHAGFDHYFITSLASEIQALDSGALMGWARTGHTIPSRAAPQPAIVELCRFYIPPANGDSHFFSASPAECDDVARRFPSFLREAPSGLFLALPDTSSGACPTAMIPVYRVWNRRADTNHRYTLELSIRNRMVAQGGVAEGYGSNPVALCALP